MASCINFFNVSAKVAIRRRQGSRQDAARRQGVCCRRRRRDELPLQRL